MTRTVLSNARIVTPTRDLLGSLVIEDGRITDIVEGKTYGNCQDLDGLWVCPGLVDLHSDYFEREINPRPGSGFRLPLALQYLDSRAATAGITSLFNAISFSESILENRSADRALLMSYAMDSGNSQGHFLIRHYLHARLEVTEETVLEYVDKISSLQTLRLAVYNEHVVGRDRQHKDGDAYIKRLAARLGRSMEDVTRYVAVRTEKAANARNVRQLIYERLQGFQNVDQISIGSHDDTTEEHVKEAFECGAKLCEFPTSIEAARCGKRMGMTVALGAPNFVLGYSQSGNVSCREAVKEGLVDILCSDYHFPAMLTSVAMLIDQGWSPSDAVSLVTLNPARMVKLDGELGSIEVGKKADLVVFEITDNQPRVHRLYVDGELRLSMGYPPPRRSYVQNEAAIPEAHNLDLKGAQRHDEILTAGCVQGPDGRSD